MMMTMKGRLFGLMLLPFLLVIQLNTEGVIGFNTNNNNIVMNKNHLSILTSINHNAKQQQYHIGRSMKQQQSLLQLNNNIIMEDKNNDKNNRFRRFLRNKVTKVPKRIISTTINRKSKSIHNTRRSVSYRTMLLMFASLAVSLIVKPTIAIAMGGGMGGGASKVPVAPIQRKEALSLFGLFFALFGGLALLHAAEIAITTLYPWKVREFAEEVRTLYDNVCVFVLALVYSIHKVISDSLLLLLLL